MILNTMGQCFPCFPGGGKAHKDRHANLHGCYSLEDGIQQFSSLLTKANKDYLGNAGQSISAAIHHMIRCLLLGPQSHLPQLRSSVYVHEGRVGEELAILKVKFDPAPLIAEVATRSRLPFRVKFDEEVCFVVLRTPQCAQPARVVVRVHGMSLLALPEVPQILADVRAELGDDYTHASAHRWWLKNKESRYPLRESKVHRIYESLAGLPGAKLDPSAAMAKNFQNLFWSMLHSTASEVDSLTFMPDEKVGTRVHMETRCAAEDQELRQRQLSASLDTVRSPQVFYLAEKFAPSASNFAALESGLKVGRPSADANKIAKVFTATSWSGSGSSGWQTLDHTWLCTDKKDIFGRTVAEQGRLIWQVASLPTQTVSPNRKTQNALPPALVPRSYDGDSGGLILPLLLCVFIALFWQLGLSFLARAGDQEL
eukprot:TRINITY_DN23558_c0_g2_i1.p1 TRINITY_DN23558_c0_g2~~TRINITY_DN23558_c0_g2_i1.p1  ORF type:complete len:427 (-),score=62.08 TRINITY_DN23558_c0_g2_i1:55-1335(-)